MGDQGSEVQVQSDDDVRGSKAKEVLGVMGMVQCVWSIGRRKEEGKWVDPLTIPLWSLADMQVGCNRNI